VTAKACRPPTPSGPTSATPRISDDRTGVAASPARQRREITREAAAEGKTITHWFEDLSRSPGERCLTRHIARFCPASPVGAGDGVVATSIRMGPAAAVGQSQPRDPLRSPIAAPFRPYT
jgi:hypothetical protein